MRFKKTKREPSVNVTGFNLAQGGKGSHPLKPVTGEREADGGKGRVI